MKLSSTVLVAVSCVLVSVAVVNGLNMFENPRNPPCNTNGNYKLANGTEVSCSKLKTVEERAKYPGCKCANNGCCSKFGFCGTTDFYCLERWGCEKLLGQCKDGNGKVIGDEQPKDSPPPEAPKEQAPPVTTTTPEDATNPDNLPKVIVKTISVACPTCKADAPKPVVNVVDPAPAAAKSQGVPHAIDEGPPKGCDADKDPNCINALASSLAQSTANAAAKAAAEKLAVDNAKKAAAQAAQATAQAAQAKATPAPAHPQAPGGPVLSVLAKEGDSHRADVLLDPHGY